LSDRAEKEELVLLHARVIFGDPSERVISTEARPLVFEGAGRIFLLKGCLLKLKNGQPARQLTIPARS